MYSTTNNSWFMFRLTFHYHMRRQVVTTERPEGLLCDSRRRYVRRFGSVRCAPLAQTKCTVFCCLSLSAWSNVSSMTMCHRWRRSTCFCLMAIDCIPSWPIHPRTYVRIVKFNQIDMNRHGVSRRLQKHTLSCCLQGCPVANLGFQWISTREKTPGERKRREKSRIGRENFEGSFTSLRSCIQRSVGCSLIDCPQRPFFQSATLQSWYYCLPCACSHCRWDQRRQRR